MLQCKDSDKTIPMQVESFFINKGVSYPELDLMKKRVGLEGMQRMMKEMLKQESVSQKV